MDTITKENKKYLAQKVNPILELLIASLMKRRPERPLDYIKSWLSTKGMEMEEKIRKRISMRPEGIPTTSESSDMDEEEELDQYEIEQEKKRLFRKQNPNEMRNSVSAEVYGEFNKKKNFKPPVFKKSTQQTDMIISKINQSFLFNHLEDQDKKIVALAMQIKNVSKNEIVIKQGDDGDVLYVVGDGQLKCYKTKKNSAKQEFLLNYNPDGDSFGELALLYNAPRAATIQALTDCTLFSLDRETFNRIVKDAVIQRRQQFKDFLSKIELLDSLTSFEKDKICDCLKIEKFGHNEFIIREGDKGNTFYFVKEGKLIATKRISANKPETEIVYEYKETDYFGELALLRDEPRAANIIAQEEVIVASIDRASFKRLLGPLEDILKRNTDRYDKFVLN